MFEMFCSCFFLHLIFERETPFLLPHYNIIPTVYCKVMMRSFIMLYIIYIFFCHFIHLQLFCEEEHFCRQLFAFQTEIDQESSVTNNIVLDRLFADEPESNGGYKSDTEPEVNDEDDEVGKESNAEQLEENGNLMTDENEDEGQEPISTEDLETEETADDAVENAEEATEITDDQVAAEETEDAEMADGPNSDVDDENSTNGDVNIVDDVDDEDEKTLKEDEQSDNENEQELFEENADAVEEGSENGEHADDDGHLEDEQINLETFLDDNDGEIEIERILSDDLENNETEVTTLTHLIE